MFVEELARWLNVRTPLSEADRQMLERYLADLTIIMGRPSRFMSVPRYSPQVARTLSAMEYRERLARLSANPDVDIIMTPSRTVPRGLLETPPDVLRNMSATGHRRAHEGDWGIGGVQDVTAIGDGWRSFRPPESLRDVPTVVFDGMGVGAWGFLHPSTQHPALPCIQTITRDDNWARPFLDTQQEIERKAHALLMRHLTPNQQDLWASRGYFSVIGEASGHRYRIGRHPQGNVYCMDTKTRYCLQFKENTPLDDLCLAQKLLLETDEMQFIKTANNLTDSERNVSAVDWNMVSAGRLSEENQNAFINYGRALMGISLATPIRPETA